MSRGGIESNTAGSRAAKKQRAVVEEAHDEAAFHGINQRVAIFLWYKLLQFHLLQHRLHVKRAGGHTYGFHPLLAGVKRRESERVDIFVGIQADAFEGSLELLDIVWQQLLFQGHRSRRIFESAIID